MGSNAQAQCQGFSQSRGSWTKLIRPKKALISRDDLMRPWNPNQMTWTSVGSMYQGRAISIWIKLGISHVHAYSHAYMWYIYSISVAEKKVTTHCSSQMFILHENWLHFDLWFQQLVKERERERERGDTRRSREIFGAARHLLFGWGEGCVLLEMPATREG